MESGYEFYHHTDEYGIKYVYTALPEHEPIEGNAMASGDDEFDKQVEASIRSAIDAGELLAWTTVRVTARFRGFEGDAYIGCVSYYGADRDSIQDFCEHYGSDLEIEARDSLLNSLDDAIEARSALEAKMAAIAKAEGQS